MPEMIVFACVLVAGALGALSWMLAGSIQPARARSLANLQRGQQAAVAETSARAEGLQSLARRLTLPTFVAMLEKQHARAGRPADWTVDKLLALKLLWVPSGAALLILAIATRQPPVIVLLVAVASITIYFVPDLLLLSRGQERAQRIQIELADTLDQMTIAVEAGLGFDAAMARAAVNGRGALAEEFTRTLQDIRMGRSRREAFEDLGARNQVPDLRLFVRAILQADAYGISIGDVLRTQAAELRLKRKQRAEEKAQQVPVKVLMPLMLCILPVLFIVVLAPAVMGVIGAFGRT
jgi:tight adherence protein C